MSSNMDVKNRSIDGIKPLVETEALSEAEKHTRDEGKYEEEESPMFLPRKRRQMPLTIHNLIH